MIPASANPGRVTMAMAIERYFNVALYLLVLTGFGTLASTGGLDMPAVLLVGCALLVRGYHLVTQQQVAIPERWTTYLTVLYVAVYFADYFFVARSFLVATVHLVLFGMVIRLFSLQRARDHFMLAVLSFLMVLAAAVLTVDSVFLFSFAGFLLVAVITFVLMEMRHSVAEDSGRAQEPKDSAPYRRMANVLLATAPMLMLMILAGGSLIFFLLPRVSSRYLSAYSPSSDLSTGFTDRVLLGRIGQIQQSNAVVMHVQIDNPGVPSQRKFGALFDGYGYFFWVRNRIAPNTTFASGLGGQRISWREGSTHMTLFFSHEEDWMPQLYEIVRAWNGD